LTDNTSHWCVIFAADLPLLLDLVKHNIIIKYPNGAVKEATPDLKDFNDL
jgi:hypothetical protein